MTTLAGKTVLLTGASGGLGLEIARALAERQATVVGVGRSQDKLKQVCAEVEALGRQAFALPFDLSAVATLPDLLQRCEALVGPVDILINNAGLERYGAFPDYSLADLQAVLTVNLLAAMELTRLVLPGMLQRGQGHIVNVASLAGKTGHPYDSVYSASKGGLLLWNHALRQELAGTGVGISALCPGYVADQGMMADTGIPAPRLAGTSRARTVAIAVVRAIEGNQAEVIINQDPVTEFLTRVLLAIEQFFPRLADGVNRWLGVTRLNQLRIKRRAPSVPVRPERLIQTTRG